MTQGERVRELRKYMNLTLEKFGSRVGVQKSAVSKIEKGDVALTDQMFRLICREFNVNPSWLRDGSGEMFVVKSRDDEIEDFINSVLTEETDSFRRRLISALSSLDVNEWKVLEKMAVEMLRAHDDSAAEKQQDTERDELHQELDRQLDLQDGTRKSPESSAG